MSENPFIDKKYIIYESPIWESCKNTGLKSRILPITDSVIEGYAINGPNDFFMIEKYITVELKKFFAVVHLAKRCDMYGIAMNQKKDNVNPFLYIPTECNTTFSNFSRQSIEYIKSQSQDASYMSQLNSGDKIFDNYVYANSYINTKTNVNDKKQLCQRLADLTQMMTDISNIINKLNTQDNIQRFQQQYQNIIDKHNDNLNLRKELENKMEKIDMQDKMQYGDSKLYLDSTVYTSVLWTILATTIVFYIFKKL
jgi:hypothetical protein